MTDAYAELEDVLATLRQTVPDDSPILDRIHTALVEGAAQINEWVGFDFWRYPDADDETEVRIYDGNGRRELTVYDGLVPGTLATVELRTSDQGSWVELDAADWYVPPPDKPGHPCYVVRLTSQAPFGVFPCGDQTVRLTSAFGWPRVPDDVKHANVDKARQIMAWDPTMPGGVIGPDDLGAPVGPNRLPDSVYRLRRDYGPLELGTMAEDL